MNINGILPIAKRCCVCYFRDKGSVLFSMLAAFIVVLLYLLFLRDLQIGNYPDFTGMPQLVDSWVISGMLSITAVTSCTGVLQIMVADRAESRDADILVTPMGPFQVAAGYILGTFVVGFLMGLIVFVISLIYLACTGCPLSVEGILLSLALLVPSALSASVVMFGITTFFKSLGAFTGMTIVVGVVIGFITGIYMPMGMMPSVVQNIALFVPATQFAAVFRRVLAGDAMDETLCGVDPTVVEEFRTHMGFDLYLGDIECTVPIAFLISFAVTLVFFAIAVFNIKKKK